MGLLSYSRITVPLKRGIIMNTDSLVNEIVAQAQVDGTYVSSGDVSAILAALLAMCVIGIIVWVLAIVGRWRTVSKMGGHGWSQLIPIYSEWELSSKAGCAQALCIAFIVLDALTYVGCIPVNDTIAYIASLCAIALFVIRCIVLRQVARRFGKGVGFTVGLVILPYIFYLILGCGSAKAIEENAA